VVKRSIDAAAWRADHLLEEARGGLRPRFRVFSICGLVRAVAAQSVPCGMRQVSNSSRAALYDAGFSDDPPKIDEIRKGARPDVPLWRAARAPVLWVEVFGDQIGYEMRFHIRGPDGQPLLKSSQRVDRTQARRFAFAGARLSILEWASGTYSGRVTLTRTQDGDGPRNLSLPH
jgi:hypothetical protein